MTRVQLGRNVFIPLQSDESKKAIAKVAELLNAPRLLDNEEYCKDVGVAPSPITLVGPNGEQVELPAEVANALRAVVSPMMDDAAASVIPVDWRLSAQEAAERLALSVPELYELLDAGDMPYVSYDDGKTRYVEVTDVLVFEARRKAEMTVPE